ncbi:hypothetical protein Tco_0908689 [Tanacetum coccineum]|uniref:Uncharacterized protein n=1 Tax=Tanacetum coccineum TaxID=301880 RepID=A0ABQ5CNY1_9ASTR
MHQTFKKSSLEMTRKLDDMIELTKSQPKRTYKEDFEYEMVMVKIPRCMSWLDSTDAYDEPIGSLGIMDNEENTSIEAERHENWINTCAKCRFLEGMIDVKYTYLYGKDKNHKKTIKNEQTRTRETEENKRAKDSKPKSKKVNFNALDSAAGGNFLDKMPREGLAIIESKSKVRYSRSRPNDSRAITNAPSSTSSPSNNSFKIQQMAALLEDKMNIRMSRLEKAISEKECLRLRATIKHLRKFSVTLFKP